MGQPHKHAELIKAWADGSEIEYRNPNMMLTSLPPKPDPWKVVQPDHAWNEFLEYRIKPEPPKYPRTRMTDDELYEVRKFVGPFQPIRIHMYAVADAAIARAIEDGDVVPAAMLEKVAEAVRAELVAQVARYSTGCSTYINGEIDLSAIIAKVKEGK